MLTAHGKGVLTTGEVAKICHVAPRTVSKWFDAGKLRGYRIPGSRDRRIPVGQLLAFMRAHGIPTDALDGGLCRILIVGEQADEVSEALKGHGHYEVHSAANGFEAGMLAEQFCPHAIVLDVSGGCDESVSMCKNIRSVASLRSAAVIAAAEKLTAGRAALLAANGFDGSLKKPYSPAELLQSVERATNIIR